MLMVVNGAFGGFSIPEEVMEKMNIDYKYAHSLSIRTNQIFIDWVIAHEGKTTLQVVEVDDNFTDYYIEDYDGIETVLYVIDGKINFAEPIINFD